MTIIQSVLLLQQPNNLSCASPRTSYLQAATRYIHRLFLEHGDFGIRSMSIRTHAKDQRLVTSLYDWETGCIVPAIFSDPLMAVWVDLVTDENAAPSYIQVPADSTPDDHVQYIIWARRYIKASHSFKNGVSQYMNREIINRLSPCRISSIKRPITCNQSREKREPRLVCPTRLWRGDDTEGYFGDLGA